MSTHFVSLFICYSVEIVNLGVIITKVCKYVESNRGFQCLPVKYYFSKFGHGSFSDVLANSYLDSTISTRWS